MSFNETLGAAFPEESGAKTGNAGEAQTFRPRKSIAAHQSSRWVRSMRS